MRINFSEFAWRKAVLLVFSLLFLVDILVLNIKVFKSEKEPVVAPVTEESQVGRDQAFFETEVGEINFCPVACLETIAEATAAGSIQVVPVSQAAPITAIGKELYIPLGGGSTKSTSWIELMGIESVIDMDNYPNIKSVVFEASMRIPTANGRVYAKLYNVTDKHDAWGSEVYAEGSSGYRGEAKGVILAPGRKLYRVKMKSTMGYEAILDSARIKILLK